MTRIATYNAGQSALLNLQRAQAREVSAGEAVASGRKADDLSGFGRTAENVSALRSTAARIEAHKAEATLAAGRLEAQDLYLNEVLDAVSEAKTAVGEAVALGRGDGLSSRLESAFARAAAALNGRHAGRPLFGGARTEETVFAAATPADLAAANPLFGNDTLKAVARVDDGVTIQTGELASEIAGPMVDSFAAYAAHVQANGGFGSPLTEADKAFLAGALQSFVKAAEPVTAALVRTGSAAKAVETAQAALDDRSTALEALFGAATEVDPLRAVTDLKHAQYALQATAQVVTQLRGSSLLDLLR